MKTSAAASQNMSPMLDHTDSADKTQDVAYVVTKFLSKGYDALSNEELAATLINPDFNATFKKQTGTDWIAKYQIQTIDKLKNTNFDLNFMTSGITHEKFNAFFVAVIKGDLEVIRDYFRKYTDDELLRIVDVSKKSPLHHAAREGRTSMADYLMTKGFRVNCRERTLKTPLHYACLFGHAVLADLLLKRGGDILAKDCSGRTAFHFACCSWSSETIALVLGLKPELINLGDNIGRTGLHYSVWNSCDAQVDIMRTILERGANINQVDDYGKTALHYAAEGGRTRAIPILIQKGIDMSLRESRTHKTALELACNERVRELMIVYSSAPYTLKSKDKSFLDSAIKGESVIVRKETLFTDEKQVKKSNPSGFAESVPIGKSNALVPEYWRSKLIGIMTQLQDIGVKSSQHIKRPYLFTGSWLEGVTTIEQLYDRVKGLSANEAMLRLFNILHPFEGDLPASNKEEVAISNFYGEYYNFEVPKETRVDLSAIGSNVIEQSKIASMHSALELANKKNEDLQAKIVALQKDVAEGAQQLSHYKTRSSELESTRAQLQKLQDTLRTKETDILMAKKLTDELESRIKSETSGKNNTIEALQKDLSERDLELAKVKKELNASKAQLKILEAGQKQDGPSAYGGSNSAKVMNKFERKRYVSQELSKEDHSAIQALMARLRTNPPDLGTRLRTEDKNADGLVNSYEFLQAMDKLKLLPEESSTLRTIAGFQKYDEIFVEDFVELVNRKMNMDGFTEKSILTSFVTAFHAKRMTVKEALAQYDKNTDTVLDIGELKQLVLDVGLMIDDKSLQELFNILDADGSGSISFDEFRTKLSAVELQKMVENPEKAKELTDKMKDKTAPRDIKAKTKDALAKLKGLNALDDALEKEKDKFETVDDAERLRNILGKELFGNGKELAKKHDYEPLVGEIKIQFQKVANTSINLKDYKMLYILIRVPGITKNWLEKEIHPYAIEQFKYAMRITVMNVLSENIGRDVVLKLVGEDKNDLRVDLGTTQVPWKKGLELANEWIVNDTFAFESSRLFDQPRWQGKPL